MTRTVADMFGIPFVHLPIPPKDQGGKRAQEIKVCFLFAICQAREGVQAIITVRVVVNSAFECHGRNLKPVTDSVRQNVVFVFSFFLW